MRTEDVLAATGTGIWRWDHTARAIALDARAAELLGLPPGTRTVPESTMRACFHVVDLVELNGIVTLAMAEERTAEGVLRVVTPDGEVQRTVRTRVRPMPAEAGATDITAGAPFVMVGTLSEVPSPSDGEARDTEEWRRSRELFLLDAGRTLAEARSTDEVLRVAATLSMPGFAPDGLAVFRVDGDRLVVVGHHSREKHFEMPFTDMPLETAHPAAEAARTGQAIYLADPAEYKQRYPTTWPLAEPFNRQSWAFLPLVVAGRTTGAWMAAFSQPAAFTPDERAVLTTVARMLAQALSRATLRESERELADGLQRTMLPGSSPDIKGMTVAARYVPTGGGLQVGGDWYDVIPLPSGRTALVIGDVQGHDVQAAAVMAQLRIAVRAYASEGHRPDAVLSRASRFLAGMAAPRGGPEADDERFATCLYIETDPLQGTLDIARAGHLDPAVRLTDGSLLKRRTAGGLPLGIVPGGGDYPTTRLVLEPGETLMVCTDGLLETGGHDVETGWARILEIFADHPDAELEPLADTLVQAIHGPPSHRTRGPLSDRREDDIALLLARRDDGSGLPVTARRTVLTLAQADSARVAEARHQLREMLYDWAAGAGEEAAATAVDGAVLLLSEMLTNVLVHTDSDALVVAEVTGEAGSRVLRVEVSDRSDELPHRRHPGELASSGRGLVLMDLLAGDWGVDPRGEGKVIWFELREDAPPPTWD